LVLSFLLTAIAVKSQQEDSGSLDKDQRIEQLTKELGLNEKQKTKEAVSPLELFRRIQLF
jgi:hypothetical protein